MIVIDFIPNYKFDLCIESDRGDAEEHVLLF
jgi:hypothetical protein